MIVEAGLPLDDPDVRARFEEHVVAVALRETPGRLRAIATTSAERLHPRTVTERHETAARARCVSIRDEGDGMSELVALLPAVLAHGIHDRLTSLARAAQNSTREPEPDDGAPDRPGTFPASHGDGGPHSDRASRSDHRSLGEVRADVFADLLLAGRPSPASGTGAGADDDAITAHVEITIPALTLLGHSDEPASIIGGPPIDLETARRLAGAATGWDRVLTHPVSGAVLAVDRYRPSDALRRILRTRDTHCRFPGCRQSTRRCDIDHTIARVEDGPTELSNLAHLCRRHHTLKHHSAWRVRQTPDGILHWTSPTGRSYPDVPARTLVFISDDDFLSTDDPPPF